MTEGMLSCDVMAGKNAYDSIEFDDYYLKKSNITSISSAEFRFRIFKKDDWSDTTDSSIITITK